MTGIGLAVGEVLHRSDRQELHTAKGQPWRPTERGEDDPQAFAYGIILGLAISLSMWAILIWLVCWFL